jgi:hypothetical protein
MDETNANTLCRSCGLCCNGNLFAWVELRPGELDPIEALGVQVFRSDPNEKGFNQPCPLWKGECTIYDMPHYPHSCRAYNCELLKEVITGKESLPHALTVVAQAKGMIREMEALLPASPNTNFRERLVTRLEEGGNNNPEFRMKANALLNLYKDVFGVKDLVDMPDDSVSG